MKKTFNEYWIMNLSSRWGFNKILKVLSPEFFLFIEEVHSYGHDIQAFEPVEPALIRNKLVIVVYIVHPDPRPMDHYRHRVGRMAPRGYRRAVVGGDDDQDVGQV